MASNPYGAYLEAQIYSASPLQLVRLAYEGAIKAVADARQHLAERRIMERGQAIGKALQLLTELARGLDFNQGGDLSLQLARLYDYMQRRLIEAHSKQIEEPLAEVQRLLETVAEGWNQIPETETETASAAVAGSSSPWSNMDRTSPATYTVNDTDVAAYGSGSYPDNADGSFYNQSSYTL